MIEPPPRRVERLVVDLHGITQPATLPDNELEYQEGWEERRRRLETQFELKPPLSFTRNGHGNGDGATAAPPRPVAVCRGGRPDEID